MHTHSHHSHHKDGGYIGTSVSATIHCLTGCAIGEFVGLAIGVSLGLSVLTTVTLATVLAFITGYLFSLIPLMRGRKLSLLSAFKIIWLGETISIAAMEIAMNVVAYYAGGMNATSVGDITFWYGFALALIAGFIAGFPVNYVMIRRNL